MKKFWLWTEEYSIPLILGILVALVWANVSYQSYASFLHYKIGNLFDIHFAVNDIFLEYPFLIQSLAALYQSFAEVERTGFVSEEVSIPATLGR